MQKYENNQNNSYIIKITVLPSFPTRILAINRSPNVGAIQ